MILKPSPLRRKTAAPLRSALRALVVSACALSSTALAHPRGGLRLPLLSPSPASRPYLAMLESAPLRFAAPPRPPALLPITPLPEEELPSPPPIPTEVSEETPPSSSVAALEDETPETSSLTDPGESPELPTDTTPVPASPPPIMLIDDYIDSARPEDVLPFFRLPTAPSSATYRKE